MRKSILIFILVSSSSFASVHAPELRHIEESIDHVSKKMEKFFDLENYPNHSSREFLEYLNSTIGSMKEFKTELDILMDGLESLQSADKNHQSQEIENQTIKLENLNYFLKPYIDRYMEIFDVINADRQ